MAAFRRSSNRRRHVLLIEDNADGRESLRLLLSFLGHQVDVAADGVEGVRKALEGHPDVVLVDIGLPRLDGYQVARQIRAALGEKVVLVAYTAYDDPDTQQRVADAGFDAHLVKPIELRELAPWLGDEARIPSLLC
ncbi:MAG TPA: response regulator [Gemmataceae bacterium]|nr:response regulator [Gemmataceae bacterium]